MIIKTNYFIYLSTKPYAKAPVRPYSEPRPIQIDRRSSPDPPLGIKLVWLIREFTHGLIAATQSQVVAMLNPRKSEPQPASGGSQLRRGPIDRRQENTEIRLKDLNEFKRVDQERLRIANLYKALSRANKVIVHSTGEAGLYQQVCRVCAECVQLDLAFICRPNAAGDRLETLTAAGRLLSYLDGLDIALAPDGPAGLDPSGHCLTGMGEQIFQDWRLVPWLEPWRERAQAYGIRSSASLPLACEDRVVSVLNLYSMESGFFTPDRLDLFREIAGDTSFALDRFAREAQRQEAEEAFRATFEQAAVGITHVSLGGQYLKLNERFSEIVGYPEEELLGHQDRDFTDPEDLEVDADEIRALTQGTRPSSCWEKRYLRKDGETIWVRVTLCLLHDLIGSPTNFVYVVEDLTSQKRSETERRELVESLHQAQKMESLGTLSAGIAHDMNNILAAILGTAEVMQISCDPVGNAAGNLATIIRASERGRDLVKKLIGFARKGLESSRLLDLNELVLGEIALLRRTTLTKVEVQTELAPGLPPILGEASAISSALMNLCVNAVQAMPEGGTLTIRTAQLADHWVELEIADSGQGMQPEVLAKAMEPFFTTKPVGKGTGLGLTIAFAMIKSHGGTLDIRSQPGEGTTISLRFPGALGEVVQAEAAPLPSAIALRPVKVLIVDDDELFLDTVPRLLVFMGHTTEIAHSGQEALALLGGGLAVDLVILDQNMPGLSGTETLDRIREHWPLLPVILGTGYLDAEAAARAAAHGGVQILHKPYSRLDIRLAIDEILAAKDAL